MTVKFTDDKINDAYIEATVEGYSSYELAKTAVLTVTEAETEQDTSCSARVATTEPSVGTYAGEFDSDQRLLTFTFPAPTLRSKLCVVNRITELFTDVVSLGQAPLPTRPEKVTAEEARCSLAPKGDCVIGLYPDALTIDQPWPAFYPNNVGVKLLRGKVSCPLDPSDPAYDVFEGDPTDTVALLAANAVPMTLTHADSLKLMFSVEQKLKRWVADVEVATICMTQEGLKNPTKSCWESDRCTQRIGYMRWIGKDAYPTESAAFEQDCVQKVSGEGSLPLVGAFSSVDLSLPSDHESLLQISSEARRRRRSCGRKYMQLRKVSGEGSLPLVGAFSSVDLSLPSDHESLLQISSEARVQDASASLLEDTEGPAQEQRGPPTTCWTTPSPLAMPSFFPGHP
ncbi:uncharacterized protein EMH_0085100 [Eimeria mitis]|uniref:Uncharacterized protein n=1 Tax=Eimeria mitis TaxID=44415 RepID=U6K6W1_9EIME|nr:uncharacterized protein EMH_0085100 [Eimeria mitis]CDJ33745.1 hypothetical protein EMH_0085100 [Eimeria mitis]